MAVHESNLIHFKQKEYMETMQTVKNRNRAKGFYFFSPKTMKFFASKIESRLIYGGDLYGYFVTSEKRGFEDNRRCYKVRQANFLTGDVRTIPADKGEAEYLGCGDAIDHAKYLASLDATEWLAAKKLEEKTL